MKWSHCYTSLADPSLSLPRFGHSAVCVNAKANWGSDLVVVYGGVGSAAGETAQTALGDVVVLQVCAGALGLKFSDAGSGSCTACRVVR
jgi:hypothetical protein